MVLLLAYLQSFEMFFEMNNLSQKVQVMELYNKQIRLSKTNTINKIYYAYKKLFAFKFHAPFFMQHLVFIFILVGPLLLKMHGRKYL